MSDYLQEVKQMILGSMSTKGIIDNKGNILNQGAYVEFLTNEANRILSQIRNHEEPGGHHLNMLYKDLDVVHELLGIVEPQQPSREEEIVQRYTEKQAKRQKMIQRLTDGALHIFGFQRRMSPEPEHGK